MMKDELGISFTSPEDEIKDNPAILAKIESLLRFFGDKETKYDKYYNSTIDVEEDPLKNLRKDIFKAKNAYPSDISTNIPNSYDTQKWLQTVQKIYYNEKEGMDRVPAIRYAVQNWHPVEIHDFLNWFKYYEQGNHMKYKMARLWYENNSPGYFLPIKPDSIKEQQIDGADIDMVRDHIGNELSSSEKKKIIEKQRNKIVSRLDSTEKLLRTEEGKFFAGKELELLLEAIYQLKKKVQTINKISTSIKLYDDLIIREANILNKKGFVKAAGVLFSLSQTLPPSPPNMPMQGSGDAGGIPSVGPGMPQNPPESAPNNIIDVESKGISKFIENLSTSNISESDDLLEVEDTLDLDDDILITEAQEIPTPASKPTIPAGPATEGPLEIKENELGESKELKPTQQVKDFDQMIDAAFANIKISDVVSKLEDLAKIFKTREIPRQLSIVDMMLDSLGLASYFPSLSEATNKSLESNNYISTRIDDILAKLHGSIESKELDLKGDKITTPSSPELDSVKQKLKQQDDKDKARKRMRQEQADQELQTMTQSPEETPKETPEINIEEDLKQPIPTKTPAPAAPIPQAR